MNKYNHILTEEEKKIFKNHFIDDGHRGRQDFKIFTNNIISKYSDQNFDLNNKEDRTRQKNYSINLIWDNETQTTGLMYCLSHPKFYASNTKFKHYKIFNGDVNEANIHGQTALMFLANNPTNYYAIPSFIKNPEDFNLFLTDKSNKTFHMYFFETFNCDSFNAKKVQRVRPGDIYMQLFSTMDTFQLMLSHWKNSNIQKTEEQKIYVGEKAIMVADGIRELANDKEYLKHYRNEQLFVVAKEIEVIGNMLHLNATMTVNEQNSRKLKI
jgi:hypothetical protein